ncbi:S41 family peptidase [Rubripirellula amarantea]|uniref:Carboxy-terminal processing protease CtpB n=1 Tax=Rubripirellula amarantea TaxID=2527999 RepID=A0A5C5WRI3_9BACT|nr:S41 family peptidase [Rubripirellula amarantea]MDA8743135.1 S41 family peptidase [Rubripirellula amarantea]TWT53514.1 Carboxy-terminal processing protease CtpB precursor [Rubripirellula amarantea]
MPPRHLNFILITAAISLLCYVTHRRTRSAMLIGDAVNLIDAFYVEPVDRDTLLTSAMKGLTDGLDEHSEYIPGEAYATFQDNMHQEFAGIGIFVEPQDDGQPVRVVTPLVGSPALLAGLLPGDEIIGVDGEDVSSMSLQEVSTKLRGPIGTQVRLKLRRGDKPQITKPSEDETDPLGTTEPEEPKTVLEVTVTRDRIQLNSVLGDYRDEDDKWVYRLKDDSSIAYLRMTSFGEKTEAELRKALNELNNDFDALVLDLRGNGGGLLNSAVEIADMFLESGNIVSTRIRGGVIEDNFDATPGTLVSLDKPIAILIDGSSASASEIVAAAIKDNGRGIVVGTRSYGKGTVQNILPLQYGRSALRLTVARYYRPNGVNIHRGKDDKDEDPWGVSPDERGLAELQPEDIEKIAQRWKVASYPSLGSPESDDAQSLESGILIDPQLRRAVELVREALELTREKTDSSAEPTANAA